MKTLTCLVSLWASLSLAQAQSYIANLDGAQDGGGLRQGSGTITLTLSGTDLTLSGSFSGLTTPSTLGHIHGPAPVGVNASPIYDLIQLGIVPLGVTAGSINGTVQLVAKGTGGSYTVAQQISDLNNSLWYVNIHDSTFPGGEIRGQIVPVPEPSTFALFGVGGVGLICWVRRRVSR